LTTLLKLGGELLEDAPGLKAMAAATGALAAAGPLVVVHGGGRAIDAELRLRGLEPRFVDGLRVTDAAALESVISVLAGRTNTAFRRSRRRADRRGRRHRAVSNRGHLRDDER
jgi:acetylglutamate kinase